MATRTVALAECATATEMYTSERRKPLRFCSLFGPKTASHGVHLGVSRMTRAINGLRSAVPRPTGRGTDKSPLIPEYLGIYSLQTAPKHGVIKSAAARGISHTEGIETREGGGPADGEPPRRARHLPHRGN